MNVMTNTVLYDTNFLQLKSTPAKSGNPWVYAHRPNAKDVVVILPHTEDEVLFLIEERPPIQAENRGKYTIGLAAGLVGDERAGESIEDAIKAEMTKRGIPFDSSKRAVQVTKEDYDAYDMLVCMEAMNVRDLMRIIGFDKDRKVKKLLDFTNHGGDIADPWYSGDFTATYKDIVEGCEAIIKQYKEGILCQ